MIVLHLALVGLFIDKSLYKFNDTEHNKLNLNQIEVPHDPPLNLFQNPKKDNFSTVQDSIIQKQKNGT